VVVRGGLCWRWGIRLSFTEASGIDAWGWDSVEMRGDRTLYPS
jgi:hypothetical protein